MEKKAAGITYTNAFSDVLNDAAATDDKIVAITAAMPDGTGLTKFAKDHPARYFDVGIAEQHAVTFAAGLAASGYKPVCAIYSTFLQRAYDIIIHDVALQHLPVKFFLDRAGLVGDDGGTHHGVFDLSYLGCIPNMVVMAPKDTDEMRSMTRFALDYSDGPIAVRYPRGSGAALAPAQTPIELGKAEVLSNNGDDVLFFALGAGVQMAVTASELIAEKGLRSTVVNARFCKPLDVETLVQAAERCARIVTIEENVVRGGFGSAVLQCLNENGVTKRVEIFALPDHFIEHGPIPTLRRDAGLTAEAIAARLTGSSPEMYDPARREDAGMKTPASR
jgi:1-deoxy-D-xylulose-5-phosphate synthase